METLGLGLDGKITVEGLNVPEMLFKIALRVGMVDVDSRLARRLIE